MKKGFKSQFVLHSCGHWAEYYMNEEEAEYNIKHSKFLSIQPCKKCVETEDNKQ